MADAVPMDELFASDAPLAELAAQWDADTAAGPGVPDKVAALRWLSHGEAIAERVAERRGEGAVAALMAGATVGELAMALHGAASLSFNAVLRRRIVRDLVIGWTRDAVKAGRITAARHREVRDRLDAAG